jgi:exosortase/archaeosortase family protein
VAAKDAMRGGDAAVGPVGGALRLPEWWPLVPGLVLLAAPPARWLLGTWLDPSYPGPKALAALLALALIVDAARSPLVRPIPGRELHAALYLELVTAVLRVLGERLAVHAVSATALVVDVLALGLGLGLAHRRRAARPLGVAMVFALSLPAEQLVLRSVGFPLQLGAARLACGVLGLAHGGLVCTGTRIELAGSSLSVDLPCAGARGLILLIGLAAVGVATGRLRGLRAGLGFALALLGALLGNALRLVAIAEGARRGADLVAEPAHSIVGLATLALGALPVLALGRRESAVRPPVAVARRRRSTPPPSARAYRAWGLALVGAAVPAFVVPAAPIDVGAPAEPPPLPVSVGEWTGERLAPSAKEQAYYARFGGRLEKQRYWRGRESRTVMVVRTRAPLRHLHAPDECLIGEGHDAHLVGVRADGRGAVYRSRAPDGAVWRVEVAYRSSRGEQAASPAEATWRWLRRPDTAWTMVQQISPWPSCDRDPADCQRFDRDLRLAMEDTTR